MVGVDNKNTINEKDIECMLTKSEVMTLHAMCETLIAKLDGDFISATTNKEYGRAREISQTITHHEMIRNKIWHSLSSNQLWLTGLVQPAVQSITINYSQNAKLATENES